jgi:hypothetical protein
MKKVLSPGNGHTLNEIFLDVELATSATDSDEGRIVEETGNAYHLNRQAGYESNARGYPQRLPVAGFEMSSYALSNYSEIC